MKKVLCVAAVLGIALVAASPAQAARYSLDETVTIAVLQSTGSPPVSGTSHYAGTVEGDLGSGAIVGTNVFGPVPNFEGPLRVFYKKGSLKGKLAGSGTPNPDGSISFSGTGTITKGTGKYKGAKGKFSFSGTQAADATVTTFEVTGSVKY
jgi:hypothetical protein